MKQSFIFVLCLFLVVKSSEAKSWIFDPEELVSSARKQIQVTVGYDSTYRSLSYPGGDVPRETGVCTDVLIRALREQEIDLQKEVHEDMAMDFHAYPQIWGLIRPDKNIDHRRVPNLMTFLKRRGYRLENSQRADMYQPGDIVTWNLSGSITHIGIVSNKKTKENTPLVIHNIGRGTQEENILFQYEITGHYRIKK